MPRRPLLFLYHLARVHQEDRSSSLAGRRPLLKNVLTNALSVSSQHFDCNRHPRRSILVVQVHTQGRAIQVHTQERAIQVHAQECAIQVHTQERAIQVHNILVHPSRAPLLLMHLSRAPLVLVLQSRAPILLLHHSRAPLHTRGPLRNLVHY